ncbi:hypothetical protein [Moorena sp. SIO3H5]|uniref:hypothetical protein n=1 Tax=Moorena sp. SIO3H5 TaxID=2607834 RepID=UPI0013B94AD5|nr:hypothetical protein [Moorena sp. SIO3H5]NEO70879.1 hypothetical protein [Moorena sp. SIO3H5]
MSWNRYLALEWASGVERASCLLQFSSGQDAHSTHGGILPTLLLLIQRFSNARELPTKEKNN